MENNKLILVTAALIFCCISWFLYQFAPPEGHCDIDSSEYISIGKNYSTTGNLVSPDHPTTMPSHTIGYHWFLGIIFSVFGQLNRIFFLQIVLSLLCGMLLYALACMLFDQTVAAITLLLFSCNLGFLVYSQLILAEIVLVTFLVGFLYYFCLFIKQHTTRNLASSGFLLGCSIIIKPVALYFIAPLSCMLFLCQKQQCDKKQYSLHAYFLAFIYPLSVIWHITKKFLGYFV